MSAFKFIYTYPSMNTLNTQLQKKLTSINIKSLTKIQQSVIPLFSSTDIMAQSPTGSGKTLAYVLPVINYINHYRYNISNKSVQCLVLLPTRELAIQVYNVFMMFEDDINFSRDWEKENSLHSNDVYNDNLNDIENNKSSKAEMSSFEGVNKSHNDLNTMNGNLEIEFNGINTENGNFEIKSNISNTEITKSKITNKYKNDEASDKISDTKKNKIFSIDLKIGGQDSISVFKNFYKTNTIPTILIATPGILFQLIKYNQKAFTGLKFLVLDEADKLLNHGFFTLIENILSLLPKQRITSLFTATLDDSIKKLSTISLRNYKLIVNDDGLIPERLSIQYIMVTPADKLNILMQFMKYKCIVFFSSSAQVDFFHELINFIYNQKNHNNNTMADIKNRIYKIHGKMKNEDRFVVYENFKKNGFILFCTDLSARGIDFEDIDYVIHFDCPVDPSNFVHRSGRTARNGKNGISILLLMKNEEKFIDYLKLKKININEYTAIKAKNAFVGDKNMGNDGNVYNNGYLKKEIINDDSSNNAQNIEEIMNTNSLKQTNNKNLISKNYSCNEKNLNTNEIISNLEDNVDDATNTVDLNKLSPNLNDDLRKLAVLAFVSYIRSYKEYHLSYIFNLKEIDFDSTASLYCLIKIPQMKEIQNIRFTNFLRKKSKKSKKRKFNK